MGLLGLAGTTARAQAPQANPAAPASESLAGPIDNSRQAANAIARNLLTPTRKQSCAERAPDGGIVVCGKNEENDRQKLPIPGELATSHLTGDGTPRAPDLFGIKKGAVTIKGCFLPPCPGEFMPLIDVAALPKAPEGSDADLIAKGEIRAP